MGLPNLEFRFNPLAPRRRLSMVTGRPAGAAIGELAALTDDYYKTTGGVILLRRDSHLVKVFGYRDRSVEMLPRLVQQWLGVEVERYGDMGDH